MDRNTELDTGEANAAKLNVTGTLSLILRIATAIAAALAAWNTQNTLTTKAVAADTRPQVVISQPK